MMYLKECCCCLFCWRGRKSGVKKGIRDGKHDGTQHSAWEQHYDVHRRRWEKLWCGPTLLAANWLVTMELPNNWILATFKCFYLCFHDWDTHVSSLSFPSNSDPKMFSNTVFRFFSLSSCNSINQNMFRFRFMSISCTTFNKGLFRLTSATNSIWA